MSQARSFAPIAPPSARVLILGSMPGEASLRARQYYAFPHNQFWPIMGALFGAGRELPYARRVARLRARRVAVWDVLRRCERAGSLDGAIVRGSEVPNDFAAFFRAHRALRAVFFNGARAQQAFARLVAPRLGDAAPRVVYERLPSTSPAHAGLSAAAKLAAWRRVREFA
jgi:double-stranded uracil-DNA glycosylase